MSVITRKVNRITINNFQQKETQSNVTTSNVGFVQFELKNQNMNMEIFNKDKIAETTLTTKIN